MDHSRRDFLKTTGLLSGAVLVAGVSPISPASALPVAAHGGARLQKPTGVVTLNVWTWAWPSEPLASQYKKAFERAHPEIDLQVKQFTYPDYITALATGMPVGQAGDVMHLETGSLMRKYSKFLMPLSDLAAESYGSNWKNQFIGGSVDEIKNSVSDGAVYALPQQYSVGGIMWANKNALSNVGATLPVTYKGLVSTAAKLRKKNISAVAWGAKDQWPNTDYLIQFASQWKPGVVEAAEAGKVSFTDSAIVNALAFMKKSIADGIYNKAPFATTSFPTSYNNFFYGKSAFASVGTWGVNLFEYEKVSDKSFEAFLFPKLPGAPSSNWIGKLPTGSPVSPGGVNPVRPWRTVNVATAMRNDLTPDKQWAAWKFIEYWCGIEGQILGASTWTPARIGLKPPLSAAWKPIYDWQTSLAGFGEKRQFDYDQTRSALQDAIANVCARDGDPKKELAKVDAAAARGRDRANL